MASQYAGKLDAKLVYRAPKIIIADIKMTDCRVSVD